MQSSHLNVHEFMHSKFNLKKINFSALPYRMSLFCIFCLDRLQSLFMMSNFERKPVPELWTRETKTRRAHLNCLSSRHHKVTAWRGWQTCGLGESDCRDWLQPATVIRSNRTYLLSITQSREVWMRPMRSIHTLMIQHQDLSAQSHLLVVLFIAVETGRTLHFTASASIFFRLLF